jgi:hypothetical protein
MEKPDFDHCYIRSIASWFALHLNTFDFKWPWDEWRSFEGLPEYSSRAMFLQFTFEYLGRLSYAEKLTSSVPSFLHHFLPPPPQPCVSQKGSQFDSFVGDIKSKRAAQELLPALQDVESQATFTEALLLVGSKSYSHVCVLIDRYGEVFKAIAEQSADSQVRLVSTISLFWCKSAQNFELIVAKLMELGHVSPQAFIEWSVSNLEGSVGDSSCPLFAAIIRSIPTSVISSAQFNGHVVSFGRALCDVSDDLVADRQSKTIIRRIGDTLALRNEH